MQTSNALVTVWPYNKMNEEGKGYAWLDKQIARHPDDKALAWAKGILEQSNTPKDIAPDSNARILFYLMDK